MFDHQKLIVYHRATSFLNETKKIRPLIPPGNSDLSNQLFRASYSISLNIAEGAGKLTKRDKKRYYAIARGSALECAAIIEVCRTFDLIYESQLHTAESLLREIMAMLSAMILK